MDNRYDVIVVGAGPAGSTAALKVAKEGYSVLLIDKNEFPRDKSCGDGLTRASTKLLHQLGLLHELKNSQRIDGVKVFVKNEGVRQFDYPEYMQEPAYGLVVPRLQLDNLLYKKAVSNGATILKKKIFKRLLYDDHKVAGVLLSTGEKYYSDIVIGADGAASRVAYESSLASTPKNKLGFGYRGYYTNVEGLSNKLEIYLPILDSSSKRILPSYGWVFPVSDTMANIGVGLIEKSDDDDIKSVMLRFIDNLQSDDQRFRNIELKGKHLGAPMRFDFNPDKTFAPGLLLAGDSAGMISPFTGEGIGYAIETGIVAADLYLKIKSGDRQDFSDMSQYGKILGSKYQGYFETGTTSVNRYHLVWKVLKGTFNNDKPLFNAVRQATVFPDSIGESFFDHYAENISHLISGHAGELRTDSLAISENLIKITREDWPFLSRLFTSSQVTSGVPFRPSLFVLLAGYSATPDRDTLVKLGTAIELGFAASICHDSVSEESEKSGSGTVNWGNMISILVGDFLFSKCFGIISSLDVKYTSLVSEAISCSNRALILLKNKVRDDLQNITLEDYLELSYLKNKYAFELCMQLGGSARKINVSEMGALYEFGRYFGTAYFIADDTVNYISKKKDPSIIDSANPASVRNEEVSLMQILIDNKSDSINSNGLEYTSYCHRVVLDEIEKARAQVAKIEAEPLRESLDKICDFVLKKFDAIV